MRPTIFIIAVLGLFGAGCDARYLDIAGDSPDLAVPRDALPVADASGGGDAAGDSAVGSTDSTVLHGTFVGRAGHLGKGSASLVQRGSEYAIVLGPDFSVSPVPGPVLVLTARDSLGTALTAEDLELGALASPTGAARYAVPGEPGARTRLFVYCRPFGTEVALAALAP